MMSNGERTGTAEPWAIDPSRPSCAAVIADLAEAFALLEDWPNRYQYLIDLGSAMPPMPNALRTADSLVPGCLSRVWLVSERRGGRLHFSGASDSVIVGGLIALLLRVYNDRTPREILATPPNFLDALGLGQHLSPSRRNGLVALVQRIQGAATFATEMPAGC